MNDFWLARDDERGNPGAVFKFGTKPRVGDCGIGTGWINNDGTTRPYECNITAAAGYFNVTELPGKGEAKRYTVTTACVETVKAEEGKPCM